MCASAASVTSSSIQTRESSFKRSLLSNRQSTHETMFSDFQALVDITCSVSSQSLKQINDQSFMVIEPIRASVEASLDLALTNPPAFYEALRALHSSVGRVYKVVESRMRSVLPKIETICKIISQRHVQSLVDYPTCRDVPKKPFQPDMDDDLCREFSTAMSLQEADVTSRSLQDDLDLDSVYLRTKPVYFREDLHDLCEFTKEIVDSLKLIRRCSFIVSSALHSLELIRTNEPTRVILPVDIAALLKAAFVGRIRKIKDIASHNLSTVMCIEIAEKPYALKLFKKELISDACAEEELLVTMGFTTNPHPSILRSFGCIKASFLLQRGTYLSYGILMPYYPGGTLYSQIESRGRSPTRSEAKTLLLSIACAIREFHRRRLVHGDVKLENILLDATHPILCDFGLSHKDTEDIIHGSPLCASPESFLEVEDFESQTPRDVWSFGVVVYEYISRCMFMSLKASRDRSVDEIISDFWSECLALPEQEASQVINQFVTDAILKVDRRVEGFDGFWGIIQKCLQYPPQRRAPIYEIIHDLESLS